MESLIYPYFIEFLGTYLYVIINFFTRNPYIISVVISLLFIISSEVLGHKGDFNPALTFPKYLYEYYTHRESGIKIIFQLASGIMAYLTYKIITYYKNAK